MKKIVTIILACISMNAMSQNLSGIGDSSAQQIQLNTITTAVPFLIISPDARSGAICDAGAALSPDANSFYWNTSKLVHAKDKSAFSASYSPWLRQLVDDIHLSYLAGYPKL